MHLPQYLSQLNGRTDFLIAYCPFGTAYFMRLLTNLNARQFVQGQGGTIIITDIEFVRPSDLTLPSTHEISDVPPSDVSREGGLGQQAKGATAVGH